MTSVGPAELWASAEYEQLAERFASVHDELVERLAPVPGERWLDLATGTGAVAVRAARAGAEVTGMDIAPAMIDAARRKAPGLRFEVADAQALPYADGSFDVVSSAFGAIFAGSGEEAWQLWSTGAPPFKALVGGLATGAREAFHAAYVAYCERYRDGDLVRVPRPYLLILGRRR